jgi:hypothetical protein
MQYDPASQWQDRYPDRRSSTISNILGHLRVSGGDGGRRLYPWDSLHGEVEVFNSRGKHLGALDPVTGAWVKSAVAGRTIGV